MTKDNQLTKDYRRPGYSAVTPGLSVNGSAALLDFLKRAFDARDGDIHWNSDRTIGHGEILIGDSLIEMRRPGRNGRQSRARSITTSEMPTPATPGRSRRARSPLTSPRTRPMAIAPRLSEIRPAISGSSPRGSRARPFRRAFTRLRRP